MRTLLIGFLAATLSSPALAKKKGGDDEEGKVRVKLSTPIWGSVTTTETSGDEDVDSKYSGIMLGEGAARLEGGYLINKNFEVGTFLGFASISEEYDGEDVGKMGAMSFFPYVAYNKKVSDLATVYGQLHVGMASETSEPDGGDESKMKWTGGGLDAGARLRFVDRASLDLGVMYEMLNGKAEYDGEEVEDYEVKQTGMGLVAGVSIRI